MMSVKNDCIKLHVCNLMWPFLSVSKYYAWGGGVEHTAHTLKHAAEGISE
jgi:hypothetical protein